MVKPVVKDTFFLQMKSEPANRGDQEVIQDLTDTLRANSRRCAGMAANMIGVRKRIIAVNMGLMIAVMINPVILRKEKPYDAVEGCLSLIGERKTVRYDEIEVEYMDINFNKQRQVYQGRVAQIIQHECDHLEGILI